MIPDGTILSNRLKEKIYIFANPQTSKVYML